MLLAGLTEVFVTGMLIKWIKVKAKPIAKGAKWLGNCGFVTPAITIKNKKVMVTSHIKQANNV